MRFVVAFMLCAFASTTYAFAQTSPTFSFTDPLGPYAVGLRVIEQYDYSRTFYGATDVAGKTYLGERARPLQTLIWYPAEPSTKRPMTVADYAALLATETSFMEPKLSAERKKSWVDGMALAMATPLHAIRDDGMAPGKFPVVIYAPSFNAPSWENADLCEYLASYGYVVIASPNMGAHTRAMTWDLPGISAQAQDVSFLIGYAQTLPDTDMTKIAVGGYSWGGISNLFAAAHDSRIDALFCLDGSLRYYPNLVKDAGDVHPEQMTIPLIFFTQGEQSIEDLAPLLKGLEAPSVLNEWTHGDFIKVDMFGMIHAEYSSMSQRNEPRWEIFPAMQKGDYTRDDGVTGYGWMAMYTLHFLDAYLKRDAAAMAYLKKTPAENGVPKHLMTVKFRAAIGPPASLEVFRAELARLGFDHAAEVYASMQKRAADFKVSEADLENWAREMADAGHSEEAIQLLKWNTKVNGKSVAAYTTLGDVYRLTGQNQAAVDAYNKVLELGIDDPRLQQMTQLKIQAIEKEAPTVH